MIIYNKQLAAETPVKSLSVRPPAVRKFGNAATPKAPFRNQNVSGARSHNRFNSKALLPADVLAIDSLVLLTPTGQPVSQMNAGHVDLLNTFRIVVPIRKQGAFNSIRMGSANMTKGASSGICRWTKC